MSTRQILLMRRDVAPLFWHRPYAEVVQAAERGTDGLAVGEAPMNNGYLLHTWSTPTHDADGKVTGAFWHWAAPKDWAAFYDTRHGSLAGRCSLLFQNW